MKQKITLIITALFYINMSAQINPSQTMNGKMIKAVYDKIDMNGGEALNHLMVNPNPNTTATSKVTPNGTIIGTTTYDLQSNAAVQNRIIARGDGTISAAWTMSQLYTSVKQLTATTHELKQENTELREELKQLRTMLMRLNNIVDANSFELPCENYSLAKK